MPHSGENFPGPTNTNLSPDQERPVISAESGRQITGVEPVNHEKFDNVYKLSTPGRALFFRLSTEGTLFYGNPHELELHQMHQIQRGESVPGQPWLSREMVVEAIRSTQVADETASESESAAA